MNRSVLVGLRKSAVSDFFRLWLGAYPHGTLWHGSCRWSSKSGSDTSDDSSSSSSDSDSDSEQGHGVDPRLKEAAEGVAQSIPGQGPKVQSDLLQQLQAFAKLSKDQEAGIASPGAATKASDLLSGMKVVQDRLRQRRDDFPRTQQTFARTPQQQRPVKSRMQDPERMNVKLFKGPGLGIFTADEETETSAEVSPSQPMSLWEKVQQEQLDMFIQRPPINAFEETIQWTKEGKLWHYPINNEQGMDEEAKVGFHEHVFLENQIVDFPHRGPIRHFMELVIIGLSKNPFLTVGQKHEHIDWFRQYFKEKRDVLEEALGKDGLMSSSEAN